MGQFKRKSNLKQKRKCLGCGCLFVLAKLIVVANAKQYQL